MARKPKTLPSRIVRAVTDAMWDQSLREMRAVDRLLSPLDRRRQRRSTSPRRRSRRRR